MGGDVGLQYFAAMLDIKFLFKIPSGLEDKLKLLYTMIYCN
ncbi:hypothetical protein ES703_17079 [subsurface metagenome]